MPIKIVKILVFEIFLKKDKFMFGFRFNLVPLIIFMITKHLIIVNNREFQIH